MKGDFCSCIIGQIPLLLLCDTMVGHDNVQIKKSSPPYGEKLISKYKSILDVSCASTGIFYDGYAITIRQSLTSKAL